jgi:glycerol-3-phosphate dehydrogenase
VLRAEIEHAIDEEMALTLEDVLERRTRALLFDPSQGLGGVDEVADVMARRLDWSSDRRASEIARYRELAASLRHFQ